MFLNLTGFGVSRAVSRIQGQLQDDVSNGYGDGRRDGTDSSSAAAETSDMLRAGVSALSGGRGGNSGEGNTDRLTLDRKKEIARRGRNLVDVGINAVATSGKVRAISQHKTCRSELLPHAAERQ